MVGRMTRDIGWPDAVLAAAQVIALVIKIVDRTKAGDSSTDKLSGAVLMLQAQEPLVVETDELRAAREAAISAQVKYANALAAATVTHGA